MMEAVPNENVNVGDSTDGPRLDYEVEFNTAGTYYVWVRMRGPSGHDDSVHAGLNGSPASYGGIGMSDVSGDWTWVDDVRRGDTRVTVDVTSSGIHTVNLWMREDGTEVDQVLLTTDPDYTPGEESGDFTETDGRVAIESEQFSDKTTGSGDASDSEWISFSDSEAGSGTALEAVPNEDVNVGDSTDGPRLDYEVEFNNTGTYYVWVRMRGPGGHDDSVHAGIDGSPASYGGIGMSDVSGDWAWVDDVRRGDTRVTVDVSSSGVHTVNLWMREDGVQVDQLLLTTDPDYSPNE
jgi:hypothetical protein